VIHQSVGKELTVKVLRQEKELTLVVIPKINDQIKLGVIGIAPSVTRKKSVSLSLCLAGWSSLFFGFCCL